MDSIFDAILFQGYYSETQTLKGKLTFTFKSRSVDDVMAINAALDEKELKTSTSLVDQQLLYHLAYAIEDYNGKSWKNIPVDKRIAELKKLPAPLMHSLTAKLSAFDKKVREACDEGEENFSETPGQEQG